MNRGEFSRRVSMNGKALGREIGGGVGRKLKEILSSPQGFAAFDGDGDGFITGPNGEDKFPTPLKLASDAVKQGTDQERLDAMVDFAKTQLSSNTPVDSPAAMAKFFRIASERDAIAALRGRAPGYIEQHEFFRAALNSEIATAVASMPNETAANLAKKLGVTESVVNGIRRTLGTPQQWRVAPDFTVPPESAVSFAGRRMSQEQRQSMIDTINRLRRNGVADPLIARDMRLAPGEFALALQEMEQNSALEPKADGEVIARNLAMRGYIANYGVARIAELSGLTEEATRMFLIDAGFDVPRDVSLQLTPDMTPQDVIKLSSGSPNQGSWEVLMGRSKPEEDISNIMGASATIAPADMSDEFDERGVAEGVSGGKGAQRGMMGWLASRFPRWRKMQSEMSRFGQAPSTSYAGGLDLDVFKEAGYRLAARRLASRGLPTLSKAIEQWAALENRFATLAVRVARRAGAGRGPNAALDRRGLSTSVHLEGRSYETAMGYEPSKPMRLASLVRGANGFFGDRRSTSGYSLVGRNMSLTFSHIDENGNFSPTQILGPVGTGKTGPQIYVPYVISPDNGDSAVGSDQVLRDELMPPILRDILFVPFDSNKFYYGIGDWQPGVGYTNDTAQLGLVLGAAINRSNLSGFEVSEALDLIDEFTRQWKLLLGDTNNRMRNNDDPVLDTMPETKKKAEEARRRLAELGMRLRTEVLAKINLADLIEEADNSTLQFQDRDPTAAGPDYDADGTRTPARMFSETLQRMVDRADGLTALDAYDMTDAFAELARAATDEVVDGLSQDDDRKGLRHMLMSIATGALASVGITDGRRKELLDTLSRAGYQMHVASTPDAGMRSSASSDDIPNWAPFSRNLEYSNPDLIWVHRDAIDELDRPGATVLSAEEKASTLWGKAERVANFVQSTREETDNYGDKPSQDKWTPIFIKPGEVREERRGSNNPSPLGVKRSEFAPSHREPGEIELYESLKDIPPDHHASALFPVTYEDFASDEASIFDAIDFSRRVGDAWIYGADKPISLLLQMVARDIFGTGGSFSRRNLLDPNDGLAPQGYPTDIESLKREMPELYEVLAEHVRGLYDTTQEMFQSLGITHMYMWRGQKVPPESPVFDGIEDRRGDPVWDIDDAIAYGSRITEFEKDYGEPVEPIIGIPGNAKPLGSWTNHFGTASYFAVGVDDIARQPRSFEEISPGTSMIATIVPVDQIFGTSMTGYGQTSEYEIVAFPPEGEYPIAILPVKIKGHVYDTRGVEGNTTGRALRELLATHGVSDFDEDDIKDRIFDKTPTKEERRARRRYARQKREFEKQRLAQEKERLRRRKLEAELQAQELEVQEGFESDGKSADYIRNATTSRRLDPIPNPLQSFDLDEDENHNWIKRPKGAPTGPSRLETIMSGRPNAKMLPVDPIASRIIGRLSIKDGQ